MTCDLCDSENCSGAHTDGAKLIFLCEEIVAAADDLLADRLSHTDVANWLVDLADEIRGQKYGDWTAAAKNDK